MRAAKDVELEINVLIALNYVAILAHNFGILRKRNTKKKTVMLFLKISRFCVLIIQEKNTFSAKVLSRILCCLVKHETRFDTESDVLPALPHTS